jgi:CheY-like chemotaxis protein
MQTNAVAAELVALLAAAPDRAWTHADLARESGRSIEEVAAACALLMQWGLLTQVDSGELALSPADGERLVLVIENTASISHVVGALLESEGYRVLIAASLDLGRRVVDAVRPALVIADSFAATARQALERLAPLREAAAPAPVLLFTAHRDADAASVQAAGFGGLLPKPFDIDDLLARVAAAIAQPSTK